MVRGQSRSSVPMISWTAAEAPLPKRVAQHHLSAACRRIRSGQKTVTQTRRHAQQRYQIRSCYHARDFLRRPGVGERQAVSAIRRELFKGMILRRDIEKVARDSMSRIHDSIPVRRRRAVRDARRPSGRSSTAFTTEKIAVLAPIPSASVSTATIVNPGDFRNIRSAYFKSLHHRCSFRWPSVSAIRT